MHVSPQRHPSLFSTQAALAGACDVLFPSGASGEESVAAAVLESLLRCPLEVRVAAAERVVVVGGAAMVPGLLGRLEAEVRRAAAASPRYAALRPLLQQRLAVPRFAVPANIVPWVSGLLPMLLPLPLPLAMPIPLLQLLPS